MIQYRSCTRNIGALVHKCDPCDTPELGRVRSLVIIKKGTPITFPLDLQEWQNAIEAGSIIIVPKTIGSYDGGSPKTGDGYGDETERILSYDHVLSVKDPNYAENCEFYEAAEREVWNVAFRSATKLHYVDADCKLGAKAPIEEAVDSRIVWNLEIKWNAQSKPKVVDVEPIKELFNCHEVVAGGQTDQTDPEE